jgi:hypothetical protein
MQLLGLQQLLPRTGYRSLTACLPMLRAVKDAQKPARMATAGSAADAAYGSQVYPSCSRRVLRYGQRDLTAERRIAAETTSAR